MSALVKPSQAMLALVSPKYNAYVQVLTGMYIPSISGLVHWYSFQGDLPEKNVHHLLYTVQYGIYYDIAWHALMYTFLRCLSKITQKAIPMDKAWGRWYILPCQDLYIGIVFGTDKSRHGLKRANTDVYRFICKDIVHYLKVVDLYLNKHGW